MHLHRLGAFFILTCTLFYGVFAILKLKMIKDDFHAPLGISMLLLVCLLVINGLAARYSLHHSKSNKQLVKQIHRYFGFFLITLGHLTVCLGIYAYFRNKGRTSYLPYIALVATVVLVVVLEIRHWYFLNQKTPVVCTNEQLAVISYQEALESHSSRDLLIVCETVVDVTEFKWEHPGGRILIEKHRGRDVSCYFNGGLGDIGDDG